MFLRISFPFDGPPILHLLPQRQLLHLPPYRLFFLLQYPPQCTLLDILDIFLCHQLRIRIRIIHILLKLLLLPPLLLTLQLLLLVQLVLLVYDLHQVLLQHLLLLHLPLVCYYVTVRWLLDRLFTLLWLLQVEWLDYRLLFLLFQQLILSLRLGSSLETCPSCSKRSSVPSHPRAFRKVINRYSPPRLTLLGTLKQPPPFILDYPFLGRVELCMRCPTHCLVDLQLSLIGMRYQQPIDIRTILCFFLHFLNNRLFLFWHLVPHFWFFLCEPLIHFLIGLFSFIPINDQTGSILPYGLLTFILENRFWYRW